MVRHLKTSLVSLLIFLLYSITLAQTKSVSISGVVKDQLAGSVIPYVNVVMKSTLDSSLIAGTVTNEDGLFLFTGIAPGNYLLEVSFIGYKTYMQEVFVGKLSEFLDLGNIHLEENAELLKTIEVTASQDEITGDMDKKTYSTDDNISQGGGSVLQAMQNLPGVTIKEGKVELRGNDKVVVLIDGKQTALTGFGNQTGLDNIPASAIEKIEIINNPSAKYDANGNAGIINIIYKKNKQDGLNGKVGITSGLGALWVRKENLPDIRPQYEQTPKLNPSLSLNYRKNKINIFFQGDYLTTLTLNKNEFVTRYYDDGTVIRQQTKRNRNTDFTTSKAGVDWNMNSKNTFTITGLFGTEKILDHGDEPFFNSDLSQRYRLWQFLEDELKTTVMASATYQHKFKQAGHLLNGSFDYTFHRENEKYFFDNILPNYSSEESFKLLSDENVADLNLDYIRPLKHGKFEGGIKVRRREIPTNMQFFPGLNSPLDTNAGGKATYKEIIPALYGNYIYESKKLELEGGLRMEYVQLNYDVNPNHNTYKSDGYDYLQPFPNVRLTYKFNDHRKLSLFYNRRVDRPNEVDIRIFPKYDDAEIIKVGNPALRPQFTNSFELGHKSSWKKGYLYAAMYQKLANATISRISTTVPGSDLIYSVFQNVGRSYNTGLEMIISQDLKKWVSINLNMNVYHNQYEAYTIVNNYPSPHTFTADKQEIYSGNSKLNGIFHLPKKFDVQFTAIYLAPDIIPQGKIDTRYSLDIGAKKQIQKGRGELFFNATDLMNTMIVRKRIEGNDFYYTSDDYYETQVVRLGYNYKF